jgi:tetratricopeptide (TPR) repeat protein
MLLDLHHPKEALAEYEVALKLSPNRFNGLYNAGQAAEMAGDKTKADFYYAALLKSTNNGDHSKRPEIAHAKSQISSTQSASTGAAQ